MSDPPCAAPAGRCPQGIGWLKRAPMTGPCHPLQLKWFPQILQPRTSLACPGVPCARVPRAGSFRVFSASSRTGGVPNRVVAGITAGSVDTYLILDRDDKTRPGRKEAQTRSELFPQRPAAKSPPFLLFRPVRPSSPPPPLCHSLSRASDGRAHVRMAASDHDQYGFHDDAAAGDDQSVLSVSRPLPLA